MALGACLNLCHVTLPDISQETFKFVQNIPLGLFPRLKNLTISAGENFVESMLPTFDHIQRLKLTLLGSGVSAIGSFANFVHLHTIVLQFEKSRPGIIHGSHIASLARACPMLEKLLIPSELVHKNPTSIHLTDEIMNQVARNLPKLRCLALYFNNQTLTEESLISLSEHCKELVQCQVAAAINFRELVGRTQVGAFPELQHLSGHSSFWLGEPWMDRKNMTASLIERMPKLDEFYIEEIVSFCLDLS